ncbi:MAG: hypothetical protein JSS91_02190 [Bacteroidetes bacterium]|nr:hypothetical protein [Bacteroidota bacterium]
MLKSSLLEILRTFTKPELIKFGDFVRSPYFNKKENVTKLFLEIKKYAPVFADENLEKEKIWQKLFPGKDYNYGIMKNLIHDGNKLIERFIRLEYSENIEIRTEHDLLEALFERNILDLLSRKFASFEKLYSEANFKNIDLDSEIIYYNLNNVYELKAWSDYSYNPDSNYKDVQRKSSGYFIYSFLLGCFKRYNNIKSKNISKHFDEKNDFIESFFENFLQEEIELIMNFARKYSSGSNINVLNCYYLLYKSISSKENVENYFNLKQALYKYGNEISNTDLISLYAGLNNYLLENQSGDINTAMEFTDNYKTMMSRNLFLEPNGKLREYRFNMYIYNSCNADTCDETLKFISEYLDKIPEISRSNSYNFGMALVHFAKSEFNKSLEFISKISQNYFDMKYQLKNLMLMIYYELNDYDAFLYSLDTNKHFLNNNKAVDDNSKESANVFLNLISKLFKLRENFNDYDYKKLDIEISKSFIMQRKWFLEKLKELNLKVIN